MMKFYVLLSLILSGLLADNNIEESKKLYQQCAKCHGIRGEVRHDSIVQFIAGWDKEILLEVLKEYKSGTRNAYRRGSIMSQSVQDLNDEQLSMLATYISTLRPIVPFGFDGGSLGGDLKKGQKFYYKDCKKCHGNGSKGAAMHTMAEWWRLFKNNGQIIIEKHQTIEAKEYFNSPIFKERFKDLYEFLHEFSSDSPNLPPPTG